MIFMALRIRSSKHDTRLNLVSLWFVLKPFSVHENSNCWIIDSGATIHVMKDRGGFREFRSIDIGKNKLYMGNSTAEDVLGVSKYFIFASTRDTLVLHETLFVFGMQRNLLSCMTREGQF